MTNISQLPLLPEGNIKLGFDTNLIELRIDQILFLKKIGNATRGSNKYKRILASIKEVGIIEPPVVIPDDSEPNLYILLDGHLRVQVLQELKIKEVTCLVSTDDEAFTYNKYINRLSPIQEHRMILRAVERGVPEKKIAEVLNFNLESIVRKRTLLDGICPKVIELLHDKTTTAGIFPILKRMKPERQMEAAMLMNDAAVYSIPYAKMLLAATPNEQLVEPLKPKKIRGLSGEQMERMTKEMEQVERQYRLTEETYRTDVMNLTLAKVYLNSLLSNARVLRYLAKNHPEMLKKFQELAETKTFVEQTLEETLLS